ncbi:MAG: mycofactocin-coupled SDR family oxidoreductase [Gaiellales bacterium]
MGRLEGKVAFVTGAARGVGRSIAVRLAEEGADIVALDLCAPVDAEQQYPGATEDDLDRTAAAVESLGRRIVARRGDVRDFATVEATVAEGVTELGRIDVVAANAGSVRMGSLAHETTEDEWSEMLGVNLTGAWNTARAAIPRLIDQEAGGSIVLISSLAGLEGAPMIGAYTAAKHGVVGLMRTLALELGPHRIRANTIHPGGIDTAMGLNDAWYRFFLPELENPTRADYEPIMRRINALPVAVVDPVDIANAVVFLASDEARYITGVTLPVDAGAFVK